ncbi:MAG: hypothetical protein JXR37_20235 [Kiritimatiellae bacterium]|nr:hypothetical protein [Kiritimatiellia bacterium]
MIFAPERMVRLDVLTLCEDVERMTRLLAREGCLHVVERDVPTRVAEPGAGNPWPSHREEIDRLAALTGSLLRRLDLAALDVEADEGQGFLEEATGQIVREGAAALADLQAAIDRQFEERDDVAVSITELDVVSEKMHLLAEHGLSFRDLHAFEHLHAVCGTVDRTQLPRLSAQLGEEACALAARPAQGKRAAFLVIGDRDRAMRLDAILKDAGAQTLPPPERFVGSFEEGLERIEVELWQQRDRLAELNRRFTELRAAWHKTLSVWRARLRVHRMLDAAAARFRSDGMLTLLSGFVPESCRASLIRRLERDARGLYYAGWRPAERESDPPAPTRLRNWKLFRPFELFVKTYGLPGYNDVDPTPFVAISFLAMFGMMFGDVGHGLVLAGIGAGMAFLPYRLLAGLRGLGRILLMAGLAGMLFGFLFGSVFGVERDAVLPALWMRPSHAENLVPFLGAALGLGVLILSTGIVLNIVQAVRQRDLRKALIGQWSAASLIFFWALLVLFGLRMVGKDIPAPPGLIALVLAAPLCLIAGGQLLFRLLDSRGRRAGRPHAEQGEEGEEPGLILFEPIEIVMNLFTNSVSFLRVAAFGLAHAALTMATFVIKDTMHAAGAGLLPLPFEHLFIILLEGMIVTIQCLRLEYYEFFSKFFRGNGVAYAPLAVRFDKCAE